MRSVIFDVNGTLTEPAAIGTPWEDPDLGEAVLAQAISTATVDAVLATPQRPFTHHLRAAIEVCAGARGLDLARTPDALARAGALPARPGAAEALTTLRAAGLQIVALTNSGAEAGRRTLEANGLAASFDAILGVDAVGTFKPHPSVYAHGLAAVAGTPAQTVMVATHPWDLAAAAHCGMATGWVTHGAPVWPAVFVAPDFQADTLPELARAIVAGAQ